MLCVYYNQDNESILVNFCVISILYFYWMYLGLQSHNGLAV